MHNVIRSLFPDVIVLTLATALSVSPVLLPAQASQMYLDPSQPIDKRVDDLVSRMTLEEKITQMVNTSPAIPRLGVPAYDWWSEGLHGIARSGYATMFPQAIGAWLRRGTPNWSAGISDTISTEARAKYNDAIRQDIHSIYYGLTIWSPNINIFPRSALGTRAGDLRRRSVPHQSPRRRLRSRACKAPIPTTSRPSRRPSTSQCIAALSPTGTASTSNPRPTTCGTPTCPPSAQLSLRGQSRFHHRVPTTPSMGIPLALIMNSSTTS